MKRKYQYQTGLTCERLKEVLRYEPETGKFFWLTRPCNRVRVGDQAGRLVKTGHRTIQVDGRYYSAGRLAWLCVHGEWPKHILRYLNKNQDDNRVENMRDTAAVTLGLRHDGGKFEQTSETKEENVRNYYKNFFLKKTFGIDLAEYQRMFIAQDGKCGICFCAETDLDNKGRIKWLAVDHCHSSGKVRGLLCGACNKAIGLLKEDANVFRSAMTYLEKHSDVEKVVPLRIVKEST